jgi:hypothetical protein
MFQFQNAISISDIMSLIFLGLAIIGIFLTRHQIKQGYNVQKASFFKDLFQTMYGDPEIRNTFYLIEHGKFVFDDNFYESGNEQSIDRLLCFVDLICGLYAGKMLTKQEMIYFEFELIMIYHDPNVQVYLEHLRGLYKERKFDTTPFASFVSYCQRELADRASPTSKAPSFMSP